ncbi:hypothetical protein PGTUg99_000267 [Puccinia graminis f. sp. tritici]|uniref:TNase-like domain-containing protein n=1 Tax=Puccinia graminis f. sp. tritici TaxID=56615 RepID=A0A5B0PSN2_PUCGR|nr:hypothetical protein PGTUg99_000267 [Puccinia graminis f. sp. tritici]
MASATMKAIVKSVLSGDTLILRGRPINGQPPKERTLHLAGTISYTIPSGGEFGVAHLVSGSNPPVDVALEMVKNGWAKLRENTKPGNADDENDGESSEQDRRNQLKEAEETARREGRGVWAEDTPNLEINYSMPEDPAAFLSEYKGKTLDGP